MVRRVFKQASYAAAVFGGGGGKEAPLPGLRVAVSFFLSLSCVWIGLRHATLRNLCERPFVNLPHSTKRPRTCRRLGENIIVPTNQL